MRISRGERGRAQLNGIDDGGQDRGEEDGGQDVIDISEADESLLENVLIQRAVDLRSHTYPLSFAFLLPFSLFLFLNLFLNLFLSLFFSI